MVSGGPMQVRIQRASGMPHGVQLFIQDEPDFFIVWIDHSLISEEGAQLLGDILTFSVRNWNRTPNYVSRPQLKLHIG